MRGFLIIVLTFASMHLSAVTLSKGSLSILNGQREVNMVCDFEDCMVDHHTMEWAKARHENWDLGIKESIGRFNEGYLDKSPDLVKFGDYPNARYTLRYYVKNIDDDQDTEGYIHIVDNTTNEVVVELLKADGKAGTFGSFFNLLGDAFEDLGQRIAKLARTENLRK